MPTTCWHLVIDPWPCGSLRDCIVYGTEDWRRDAVPDSSETMPLVFSAPAVTSILRDTAMSFAKATDVSQKLTVSD